MSVTAASLRPGFWSIKLLNVSKSPWNLDTQSPLGGIYQPQTSPNKWPTIFEDIHIIFPSLKDSEEVEFKVAVCECDQDGNIKITHEGESEEGYPTVEEKKSLYLNIILHHPQICLHKENPSNLQAHVNAGCARIPELDFDYGASGHMAYNMKWQLGPPRKSTAEGDDSDYSDASGSAPSLATTAPPTPTKRLFKKPRLSSGRSQSEELFKRLGDRKTFEGVIKLRDRKCAVSKKTNQITLGFSPGFEAAHIVPLALWFSYPVEPPGEFSLVTNNTPKWESMSAKRLLAAVSEVRRPGNGILLRADIHAVFDRRLLAIHPVTKRIRVFGPLEHALEFHGLVADFGEAELDKTALKWHWRQCVLENTGALYVDTFSASGAVDWKVAIDNIFQSDPLFQPPTGNPQLEGGKEGKSVGGMDGNWDDDDISAYGDDDRVAADLSEVSARLEYYSAGGWPSEWGTVL
ncbi:hypothetical protein TWF281_010119 [Arthrobotrys megalospora]